jgi:general secretion pathway protein L
LAIALAYCSGEIFNLRNGPLAWTGKRSHLLKQFRIPLVLAMLILLLLPAEAGLRWFLLSRDIRSINTSVATIYKGIFPTRKKAVDETAEVRAEIRHLTNGTARSELLPFLHLLAQAKDEQIFGFSEVEYDGERFRLKGNAKNNEAVTALGNRLSATGWAVEQPELTARPDTTTLFVLKGRQGGRQP